MNKRSQDDGRDKTRRADGAIFQAGPKESKDKTILSGNTYDASKWILNPKSLLVNMKHR